MAKFKPKIYNPHCEDDSNLDLIKANIPKPIFRWIIVGSTGCGKTNLIKNLLFNSGYEKYFDDIIIYSGSIDDCEEYRILCEENRILNKTQIRQVFNQEEFQDVIMRPREEEIDDTGSTTTTLLVLDDQITHSLCRPHKAQIIDEIFVRGRHIKISVIIATQRYMALNQNIRQLNSSTLTLFSGTSQRDITNIAKEHCGSIDENEFRVMIEKHIQEKYSYITLEKAGGKIYDKNFEVVK